MKVEGQFTFAGAREEVWALLHDPEILASSLPGTERLDKIGEDEYQSEMNVRVGPVNGLFLCKVTLKDKQHPESYTMLVDSNGNAGFAKGTARVQLHPHEGGQTLLTYEADLQIGGRLASVGQRLLDTVGKSMIRQGLEAMNQALQARMAPGEAAEQPYVAPTQGDFAKGVAKDVVKESFSGGRIWWILAVAAIIAAAAWVLL